MGTSPLFYSIAIINIRNIWMHYLHSNYLLGISNKDYFIAPSLDNEVSKLAKRIK